MKLNSANYPPASINDRNASINKKPVKPEAQPVDSFYHGSNYNFLILIFLNHTSLP